MSPSGRGIPSWEGQGWVSPDSATHPALWAPLPGGDGSLSLSLPIHPSTPYPSYGLNLPTCRCPRDCR